MDNKIKFATDDIAMENREKLASLFPGVINDDGIDIDLLKSLCGYYENENSHYSFKWHGKDEAMSFAYHSTSSTLAPDIEHNEKEENKNSQNLYIEGDNLEVLKILRKSYFNKIKMIYIDPPYNTENDFIYPDNYSEPLKNYMNITKQNNSDDTLKSTNTEKLGRKHTNWLNMIYPRLLVARDLLTDDGVIFISIDDNEQANLKKICDEVMGGGIFTGN